MHEDNDSNKNKLDSVIELKEEIEEYIFIQKNSYNFKSNRKKDHSSTINSLQSPSGL